MSHDPAATPAEATNPQVNRGPVASRRALLGSGLALAGGLFLNGCAPTADSPVGPGEPKPTQGLFPGQVVVEKTLRPAPAIVDLGGGLQSEAWVYNDTLPGVDLRAHAGELLRITVDNQLPAPTTVHWHGMAVTNDVDGVPGLTQDPIQPGTKFRYEFTAPAPGTYFFRSHVGLQLDRGLYGPLIIDDPAEPGHYDAEWIVILDDWLATTTPDDMYSSLVASRQPTRAGQDAVALSARSVPFFGDAGDIRYPHYLINGAVPTAPVTHQGKPGDLLRLRVINAASDTIFALALGGHRMTITHTDGHPVQPQETSALYLGMGERYDLLVTLGDGIFPLVAKPWNKPGQGLALVRTGAGTPPDPQIQLTEFTSQLTQGTDLRPAEPAVPATPQIDARVTVELSGQADPYRWVINGAPYGQNTPLELVQNQRTELDVINNTTRAHPLNLHGHSFTLPNGLRKDTILVPPTSATTLQLDATNPGLWALHCQNDYHTQAGMMLTMRYRS
ncbi:MAG: multicopper oxidase family protein [Propionibacteriaceae bacterium]|nr:multicopper oxidase family protein [Actinomycetota bacterium]MCW5952979.1 multicopper oxidase family protein [Propionibacteriaceae bacterium]